MQHSLLGARPLVSSLFLALACTSFGQTGLPPSFASEIRGRVWVDLDGDGLQSAGEPGLPAVSVQLLDRYGRELDTVPSQSTDSQGEYAFTGLVDGDYRVAVVRPEGYRFTGSQVGGLDGQGATIGADTRSDDSDLNLSNGYLDPRRRGPWPTGMRYIESTRLTTPGEPWPLNCWVLYPASAGNHGPKSTVRDVFRGDLVDQVNQQAATKLAAVTVFGLDPDAIGLSDPDSALLDTEARVDAPAAQAGPFPVALLFPGLMGSLVDMVETADYLASHGYVALCCESSAFHLSIALGGRLVGAGGPWQQSDFDHIPQVNGTNLSALIGFGYQEAGYLSGRYNQSTSVKMQLLADDAAFALDQAEAWNLEAGHPLEGRIDLSRVAWIGFSASAGFSTQGVMQDERVDLVVNIDSATYLDLPKPSLWIGNSNGQSGGGPMIQANMLHDFHGHYCLFPGVRFDPPIAPPGTIHHELQHELRDQLEVAFLGYYLKGVGAYRGELGIGGNRPQFGGHVQPYRVKNVAGLHGEQLAVAGGQVRDFDAGLAPVPLWLVDGNQLHALRTDFLDSGAALAPGDLTSYGELRVANVGGDLPLPGPVQGLALDARGVAFFAAGSPPALYSLDLHLVATGGSTVAGSLGSIAGLNHELRALAFEPRGGRLFALGGGSGRELFVIELGGAPSARSLGRLPASLGIPDGLDFDLRGQLWVSDKAGERVARIAPATGRVLETIDTLGLHSGACAFDGQSLRLFVQDAQDGHLASFRPDNGSLLDHGSLQGLGLGTTLALAFERAEPSGSAPLLDARAWPPSFRDAVPLGEPASRPLLDVVELTAPRAGWEHTLLRVQILEGSGDALFDTLGFATQGRISLGASVELDEPAAGIGEARELLFDGQPFGWYETDWSMAVGGELLAPLRVLLGAQATTPAVEALLEAVRVAVRVAGPSGRRVGFEFVAPDGARSLVDIVKS